ncbi:MAG TPA: DUF4388 domain-containing protein [Thermoanaerobaculaceae bacterium]|nr:DUF4388 domain-containing protein [Thermoanaerobaculaceae bacterium]
MASSGLAGNLRTMPVPELLQWLASGRATGTLVVSNGVVERQICFANGEIVAAGSSDPREYLGHFLVSHGFITEQQLSAAMAQQELTRVLLGKILVDNGFVSPGDLNRMLELKVREGIYDLFTWTDGEFRFAEGRLPAYQMVPMSIGVTGITLEAMERLDEWEGIRRVVPSADAVPVAVGELLDDPELSDGERAVLASVDDDRSVTDICLHTHSSEFFVAKVLRCAVDAGRLKVVRPRQVRAAEPTRAGDPAALLAEAWKLFRAGEYQAALRHARAAAALEPDNAALRKDIGALEGAMRETLEAEGVKLDRVPKVLVEVSRLAKLDLTPEEGFVLTRIDGTSTVNAILKITPVPALDAMLVFLRLIQAGHVRLDRAA